MRSQGELRERIAGLYELPDRRLATRNLVPGIRAYQEVVQASASMELRVMDPTRNKLAALILKGARTLPFSATHQVLYLGAASGATASHVSDLVPKGRVTCVEFSPRSMRDLLPVCEARPNMVPILADAAHPERYAGFVDRVDTIYMDVSQRDQAGIFLANWRTFAASHGILMIKARSVDVTRSPKDVFRSVVSTLEKEARVLELVPLDPYEADHAAAIVGRK